MLKHDSSLSLSGLQLEAGDSDEKGGESTLDHLLRVTGPASIADISNASPRKRILVINDDGIGHSGLRALALSMSELGDVCVVAPQNSCVMPSFSCSTEGTFEEVSEMMWPNGVSIRAWQVNTSKVIDCLQIALYYILPNMLEWDSPDLVVSGINRGRNVGTDLLYSGTLAVACSAAFDNIPSVAFSLAPPEFSQTADDPVPEPPAAVAGSSTQGAAGDISELPLLTNVSDVQLHSVLGDVPSVPSNEKQPFSFEAFKAAGRFAKYISYQVLKDGLPRGITLNVNIPHEARREYAVTRPDHQFSPPNVMVYSDPARRNERELNFGIAPDAPPQTEGSRTDLEVLAKGMISVSPVEIKRSMYTSGAACRAVLALEIPLFRCRLDHSWPPQSDIDRDFSTITQRDLELRSAADGDSSGLDIDHHDFRGHRGGGHRASSSSIEDTALRIQHSPRSHGDSRDLRRHHTHSPMEAGEEATPSLLLRPLDRGHRSHSRRLRRSHSRDDADLRHLRGGIDSDSALSPRFSRRRGSTSSSERPLSPSLELAGGRGRGHHRRMSYPDDLRSRSQTPPLSSASREFSSQNQGELSIGSRTPPPVRAPFDDAPSPEARDSARQPDPSPSRGEGARPRGSPLPSHEEQQQEYVRLHSLRSEVHDAKQSNRRIVFGAGLLASLAFLIGIGVGVFVREHHASSLGLGGGGKRKNSLRARG